MHEKPGCLFCYTETLCHIACRKALGSCTHFKAYEESLSYSKFYSVEQCVGCWGFGMTTFVAGSGMILSYLTPCTTTLQTHIAFFPFGMCQIFKAVLICFKPISKMVINLYGAICNKKPTENLHRKYVNCH